MKKTWKDHIPPKLRRWLHNIKATIRSFVIHLLFSLFSRCPIQSNKIVFDNYKGQGYSCNPKYVAQKLIERWASAYEIVWLVSRENMAHSELPPQIRPVRYDSVRSYYEYATSRVWVSNYPKMSFVRNGLKKRVGQVFVQTLHGSLGIKKIDGDVETFIRDKHWLSAAIAGSKMTDFWISNSTFETSVYKSAFWDVTDEEILLYGHPRNDIFFDPAKMLAARQKVSDVYGLEGKRLLLYAPTFREDYRTDCYGLDYPDVIRHIKRRFGGEWAVLVRLHPRISDMGGAIIPPAAGIIDATRYTDMQELLAASDCLITDYSSCAFDFMLTRRPVFLFATDVAEYNTERGFYYPLETTPFPLAHDNAELMKNIDAFDETSYPSKVEAFLKEKGCIDDGHASNRVADLIASIAPVDPCSSVLPQNW